MFSILKDYRNSAVVLAFGLTVLTILACLPYNPQGPFDARDYTRVAGMRVEQHPLAVLIEPLAAPFMIVAGAPDFSIAGKFTLIWVFFGAAVLGMFAEFRAQRKKRPFAILLKGIRTAFVASLTLALIVLLFVVARIPGWRLVAGAPDLIVADLHSHTTRSPDALVSMKTNLKWHASCGYNVVALTEHDHLSDHEIEAQADLSFERLPAFISGVEAHTGRREMLVGFCMDPRVQLTEPDHDDWSERSSQFTEEIHELCGGAVIVNTLNTLTNDDVVMLADAGVDGFEIANFGHSIMRPDLRQQVLDISRSRGLVLVAAVDWHGWTGLTRTWTVIRAPGASALSRTQQARLVLRKLRERDSANVIPVVAGYFGEPSRVRQILSPLAETLRYAQELSPGRVISWWFWVSIVFAVWVFLRRAGKNPGRVLLALLIGGVGVGVIVSGVSLIGEGRAGAASYPVHIGLLSVAIGAVALLAALGKLVFSKTRDSKIRTRDS